ncbi:MAG: guanosine-3,5-bis(diphosphate) 3-pyrophosphohydrolase [Patescibacteria group bacterium]|nr:guanosine-3,5-bis(diphosphate) 3-pyrophosphohydrolase [Patescibacteria group bacterium]
MQKPLDIEFEKAMRLLAEHFPVSEIGSRKPVLFHDIRVGVYLYEKNHSRDIVLAGVLHDALEFSDMSEETIRSEFGEDILKMVKACSKDRSIEDPDERIEELVRRSAQNGKDTLIVKAADTLDSFKHYTKTKNLPELEYCRKNAKAIFKHTPEGAEEDVFGELREWYGREAEGK